MEANEADLLRHITALLGVKEADKAFSSVFFKAFFSAFVLL